MEEKFENESELVAIIENKINEINKRLDYFEELSASFRKKMTRDFVDTVTKRFEKIENSIERLNKKLDSFKTENVKTRGLINEANSRIIQLERKMLEEKEIEEALEKLAGSEKIKIEKKLLEELKKWV